MNQTIVHLTLVVRDYDEAIRFFTEKLDFTLVEDTYQPEQDKRWVVVSPPGSNGTTLLLARASTPQQAAYIGQQTGGRVFLFGEPGVWELRGGAPAPGRRQPRDRDRPRAPAAAVPWS